MLRGINVSGQKKITIGELQALFVDLGYTNVTTYIQSGNVVFQSSLTSASGLLGAIEKRIGEDLGLSVTVLIRTEDELADVVDSSPFLRRGADPAKLHVTFLAEAPDRARLDGIDIQNVGRDEFRVLGREIYLNCPQGYGRSKLNNAFWERRLGVAATTRNWNTVTKLLRLAAEK
jgi:uncharacterized protein (DUF1697 family)